MTRLFFGLRKALRAASALEVVVTELQGAHLALLEGLGKLEVADAQVACQHRRMTRLRTFLTESANTMDNDRVVPENRQALKHPMESASAQLIAAELHWLEACTGAEFALSEVSYNRARIERLTAYITNHTKG